MDLWNIKNLDLPPRNTYKAINRNVDIVTLRKVVGEAFNTFKNSKVFKDEAALLSRCIYRMKYKFRSDKGLKEMEKMNSALLRYLRMDVPQMFQTFYGMIPHKYGHETYLPTLNMLHYILVRIQGLAKLMVRAVECSKIAAFYMNNRIAIGHMWKPTFICYAVISKIFVLTKQLTKACCKIYSELHPFTKTMQNVGVQWLPSDYYLPVDLKAWLDVDWLDKNIVLPKPKKLKIPTIFDVDSDSDVEVCGEYVEIEDDVDFVNEYIQVDEGIENKTNDVKLRMLAVEEDVGEIIKLPNKEPNIKKKTKRRSEVGNKKSDEEITKNKKMKMSTEQRVMVKDVIQTLHTNANSTKKNKRKRKKSKKTKNFN